MKRLSLILVIVNIATVLIFGGWSAAKEKKEAPKTITIIDSTGRTVKIRLPVKRIVAFGGYDAEVIYLLGESDKIVAILDLLSKNPFAKKIMPEVVKKPTPGNAFEPCYEKIIELNPDLLIC